MTIPYVGPPPSIAAAGGPHAGSVPDERVFGMPLSVSCSPERGAVNGIPSPLQACAAFVEANGAMVEGIYRVPGSHTLIQQLIAAFDHSSETLFPLYHVIVGGLSTTSAPAVDSSPVLLPGSLSLYSGPSIEAPSPMSSPILSVDSVMPVIPSSVIKPEDVHVAAVRNLPERFRIVCLNHLRFSFFARAAPQSVVKAFFRQLPDPLVPTFCNERLLPLAVRTLRLFV